MLTRRSFHATLLASLAATGLPAGPLDAATPPSPDLWLNRLTYGATPATRAAFHGLGPQVWLEDQLARAATDPALTDRLAAARLRITYEGGQDENGHSWPARDDLAPLASLAEGPATRLHLIQYAQGMDYSERTRPAAEVIAASMIRAVHATAQLREVMTQFWHDHFNVNAQKDEFTAAFFPSHDALLREGAFGNFRALLGAVARSPAMLYYLNNADSRASPANENYARELLELHSLGAASYLNDHYDDWHGVPGVASGLASGYLDLDVYEVARAFTGWSVGDGRTVAEGQTAPLTGRFHYVEAWHDPYQKRILGVEFAPNRAPMADGEQVLDLLAAHPATARFLCTKIARRLLTDDPPAALVDRLAHVFLQARDAPDQIAQVIRALVHDPAFTATPPGKIRRPFEFLAALYRATGAAITGTDNGLHYHLHRAGWRQHEYGPPTGHPDVMAGWTGASSLNRLVDFALYAHEDWFGAASLDLAALTAFDEPVGAFLARWSARIGTTPAGLAQSMGLDPTTPARTFPHDQRKGLASVAIALTAMSPQFVLR